MTAIRATATAEEIVDRALAASRADGAAVLVTDSSQVSVRWANSTMTTNGHTFDRDWTVISVLHHEGGSAVGVVSSTATDPDGIAAAVRGSEDAARQSGPARDAAPLVEGDDEPGFAEPAPETSIAVFARLVEQLAAAFDAARADGNLLYGFADHHIDTLWLATSTGLRRRWVQPTGTVEINGKVAADLTRSAWTGQASADFTDVDLAALIAELRRRLAWSARRVQLPAGRYETLLPPSAVADLMLDLAFSMEGRPAHEGRNAFSGGGPGGTRLGERLTELPLTLASDPAEPGLDYQPFLATTTSGDTVSVFDNGAPISRTEWIKDGAVRALAYPRAAADEFGAAFTPPPGNLLLTGGSAASTDDLVAATDRGLLLTCLWYIREVDPTTLLLTGLTRDGVYLVERGEVVGEVNNFRFNESPIDLLRRAAEVGATERTLPREWKDWFSRIAMPPIRIPDFNMSSVSQAS